MTWSLIPSQDCTVVKLAVPILKSGGTPAIALNKLTLTSSTSAQVLNWDGFATDEFWSALPESSWFEKVLIYLTLKELDKVSANSFIDFFRINFDETAVCFILNADLAFYSHEKGLQAGDIAILKFATDELVPLFKLQAVRKFTKSEFTQISEYVIELIQQSKITLEELNNIFEMSSEKVIESLKSKRFPLATARDSQKQQKLKQITLGHGIQTKWLRQGDRIGIEIRFFVTQEKEFRRQIDQISRLSSVLETEH